MIYKIEGKKDKIKLFRTIFEFVIIIFIVSLIVRVFWVSNKYKPYENNDTELTSDDDSGFIAISFFGVDRAGTDTLISTKRLREQLGALKDLGYVTITQQDIMDYYKEGKRLPRKALFLIFEDGRTDTAIFSEPILEQENYIATICSYAGNFYKKDNKFLKPKDFIKLKGTSFWEDGSNGYRLSYINVFDRQNRFLGEMSAREFVEVNEYIGRKYNHYLMDYIRDENDFPVESYSSMKDRISYDYQLMNEAYTKELGKVPLLYILMHSNTDGFGNNDRVSAVNEESIKQLFAMNFNREGFSVNNSESSLYDLTRLQSQAYWYTNHLLMRIWDDLDEKDKSNINFVDGDQERKAYWETLQGASEFKDNSIVLTSIPKSTGLIRLKNSDDYQDLTLSTELTGNLLGAQTIYLRASDNLMNYISVSVYENTLIIKDSGKEIAEVDLSELSGVRHLSVEEDSRDALVKEYLTRARYAGSVKENFAYKNEANEAKRVDAATVEDGMEAYIPEIQINDPGKRKVEISLIGDRLSVMVDGNAAVEDLKVDSLDKGSVYLEASWMKQGYSQRNLSDDVYDGVYNDLTIREVGGGKTTIQYDNSLHGLKLINYYIGKRWNNIVDWFITNL